MANDPMAYYDSGELSSKMSRRNSILSKVSNVGHAVGSTASGAARGAVDFTLGENSPELVKSHRDAAMLALGGPAGAMLSKSIAKHTTSALSNTINRFKGALGMGGGGGSDGYYDDMSNASSPNKGKSPLKTIEEIEETFKNDDGTTTKRRTKIRNRGHKQIIDYKETINGGNDSNRFGNKSGFASGSMMRVGPTGMNGRNGSGSMMSSGFGNIDQHNKYGAKDSLTKKDLSFITHLSKSIAAKLEKSEEKTKSAKVFHSLSKGFGETTFLTIIPNIRILSASRYLTQLPNAKKVGVFNAMNATLGMMYAAQRATVSETNRLLYSLIQVNKIGMGVDLKVARPTDITASSELISGGIKKLAKAPFRLLAAEISNLIGFSDPEHIYRGGRGGPGSGGGTSGGRRMKTGGEFMDGVKSGAGKLIKSTLAFEAARGALLGSGALGMLGAVPYMPALAAGAIGWNFGGKQMVKGAGRGVANKYRNMRQGMKERNPSGMMNWGLDKIESGMGKAFMTGADPVSGEGTPAELYSLLKFNSTRDGKYQETVVALLMRLNKMDKLDQELQEKNLEVTQKEHKQASFWRKMQTFFMLMKPFLMAADITKNIMSGLTGLLGSTGILGLLGMLGAGGAGLALYGGANGYNTAAGVGAGLFQSSVKGYGDAHGQLKTGTAFSASKAERLRRSKARAMAKGKAGAVKGAIPFEGPKLPGSKPPPLPEEYLRSLKRGGTSFAELTAPTTGIADELTNIASKGAGSVDDIASAVGQNTWKQTAGNLIKGVGGKGMGAAKSAMGGSGGALLTTALMGLRAYGGEDLTNIGTTTAIGIGGAAAGAYAGGLIGTAVIPIPIVGTVLGVIIGALLSGIVTYFGGDKINELTNDLGDSIFNAMGAIKDMSLNIVDDAKLFFSEGLSDVIGGIQMGVAKLFDMVLSVVGGISSYIYTMVKDSFFLSSIMPESVMGILERMGGASVAGDSLVKKVELNNLRKLEGQNDYRKEIEKSKSDRKERRASMNAAKADMDAADVEYSYDRHTNTLGLSTPASVAPTENTSQSLLGGLQNGAINTYNTIAPPGLEFNGMGAMRDGAVTNYNTLASEGYEYVGGSNYAGNGNIPSNLVSEMKSASEKYGIDYIGLVNDAAAKTGLDPGLIAAVMRTESNFNPNAVSSSNARGLFQFLDSTDRDFMPELSSTNPNQAVLKGASYLKYLINYFKGDVQKGILAYNFGMGNVEKGRPLTPEAANYVPKVMKFWKGGIHGKIAGVQETAGNIAESVEGAAWQFASSDTANNIAGAAGTATGAVTNAISSVDLDSIKSGASNMWNATKDAAVWDINSNTTVMPESIEEAKQLIKEKIQGIPELKEHFESKYNMSIDEILDTKEISDKVKALMTSNNISGAIASGNDKLGQKLDTVGNGVNAVVTNISTMSSNVSSAATTMASNSAKQNNDPEWITDDLPPDVQALLFAQFD